MGTEIPGFADVNDTSDDVDNLNKKKDKSKKSGGFQSMGLSFNILKGITKKGYKIPTPIQRKTIPLVLEGRDVVAMARTGSGKTACFLIPLFEKLKARTAKTGARALILSPTRELALQTLKFLKEIGRYTGLRSAVILGGDSMDDQFSAIHGNPDVIVATPGRFLHVCVEMELKLTSIEYIVFDEADRLFEMGFGEQLNDIVNRLPDSRQTLLFSATLPKVLVEFAKAGLSDPVLIRLDVESKLPNELQLRFITCRPDERVANLLVLLKNFIDLKQQTVVFAATKHHVEYLHMILDHAGITNSYIYSNLDPSARKIHAAKFSAGKVKVLIVTDVAARGIDIPQLDNVINFNFPAKSKLFVHRVGRCARAGRTGVAYSLVGPDEYAYLLDLHLFLGRPLNIVSTSADKKYDLEAVGRMPQEMIEEQHGVLLTWHENYLDLESMLKVCNNAYQQYIRSRPAASLDSNKRVKNLPLNAAGLHPMFKSENSIEEKRENILDQMKSYRPHGTVFEICSKNKASEYLAMKAKRELHKGHIESHKRKLEQLMEDNVVLENKELVDLPASNQEDINDTFNQVVLPKKFKIDNLYKKKMRKQRPTKDSDHYIPYSAPDQHTEEGLAVNNFHNEANRVQFDLTGDSLETQKLSNQLKKWDRKKKKMVAVNQDAKSKKIRTESGAWIPATYKSDRYAQWKQKTKATENEHSDNDDNDNNDNGPKFDISEGMPNTHWARHNKNVKEKQRRSELKTSDQILKARILAEKKKKRSGRRNNKNKKPRRKT